MDGNEGKKNSDIPSAYPYNRGQPQTESPSTLKDEFLKVKPLSENQNNKPPAKKQSSVSQTHQHNHGAAVNPPQMPLNGWNVMQTSSNPRLLTAGAPQSQDHLHSLEYSNVFHQKCSEQYLN